MLARKVLVNIEATPSCPAACSMCPRSVIKDDGFLSLEMMERIIDQVDKTYVWEVDLAGRGEPTVHPQFHRLLEIMKRPGITTDVTTTGVTFTQKNIDACVANVDIIRLSVSSIERPIFDRVHIGLDYDRIWRNIASLGEAAGHKVYVHLTGGPVIYDSLPQTVERLRALGFFRFYLFPLWNRGGEVDYLEDNRRRAQISKELGLAISESEYKTGTGKLRFLANTVIGLSQNRRYCPIGDGSISISHKGDILGCFQDFGHVSNVGHIDHDNLRDIIRSRVKTLGNMDICKGCNSRKAAMPGPMFFS
jgi:MoaA/NifB/PqqE/SkfB family radical SAM enzyme